MRKPVDGEAIILSQDDADGLAQAIADLTEHVWALLSRRRVLLRPPSNQSPARLKPIRPSKHLPLDELF